MNSRIVFKLLAVCVLAALLNLVGSGVAQATSATGTQNPDLTAFVSLTNDGGGGDANPDTATAGESVTVVLAVTNNTSRTQATTVTATLEDPAGRSQTVTRHIAIGAGETARLGFSYTVDPSFDTGVYALTLAASNRNGTSSATATIEIY
jgi:uncharacterized membrane protein